MLLSNIKFNLKQTQKMKKVIKTIAMEVSIFALS